jgi:asparagine synthase (glutamine-hydrolysing)
MATTAAAPDAYEVLSRMTGAMAHRGPDGEGQFVSGGVALGHRRLAIIDLDSGAQPLSNEDGSITVVYNGEIFNYQQLTRELLARGHVFRTHSDTETLVHLYEEHGMAMLRHLQGMFAFALYDARREKLFLVRDRFGIKPLYYHARHGRLYFASEIRPLLRTGCGVEVNRAGIHAFLQTRFAHGDETIFSGVHRLPEGTYLEWHAGRWALSRYYGNPIEDAGPPTPDEDADELFASSFEAAVRAWMIADVPVGAYLSGGVDSSLVVSEMTRLTRHSVRSFCVDFQGGNNEAPAAERTARALGCTHETVFCGVEELLALPDVVASLEEPVGDAVVVAQYFLSRATRRAGIKTVLTGDGADETLGGYQYLRAVVQAVRWGGWLPPGAAAWASAIARRLPLSWIEAIADLPLGVARDARGRLGELLRLLPAHDLPELYDLLLALHCPVELRGVYSDSFYEETRALPRDTFAGAPGGATSLARVLSLQYRKWLPTNINLKQDKLCMAHSVENRVPFLDHHFVEAMATVSDRLKIRGRTGKLLLRRFAEQRLPGEIARGSKVPFHFPVQHYLSDPRVWALVEDTLTDTGVRQRGYVRPEYVRTLKIQARRGDYLLAKKLMALVILELWHRHFADAPSEMRGVAHG